MFTICKIRNVYIGIYIRVLQADISCEITQDSVYGAIC